MKYNFDVIAKRSGTNCLKWDLKKDVLPMWVADMDFEVAPKIKEALINRVNIGAYGYSLIPEEFFESIISWWHRRHHVEFKREWMIYSSGVVAAISSIVRRITNIGDNVVVLSPTYNIFYNSILNNKRNVLASDLIYKDNSYEIDFIDLENKLKDEKTSLLILCNPHNPIGKIWSKDELNEIGLLAKKYNVIVLSDEIHCDIVTPNKEYNPFISANDINKEISITCVAASKTFNLAGLQSACVIIPNESLRKNVDRGLNNDEVAEPNFFSMSANITAFNDCEDWVEEMNEYIYNNKLYLYDFIEKEIPKLKVIKGDATYLVWIDISNVSNDGVKFKDLLLKKEKLFVNEGYEYGKNANSFIRINVATSKSILIEGLNRLKKFIDENY